MGQCETHAKCKQRMRRARIVVRRGPRGHRMSMWMTRLLKKKSGGHQEGENRKRPQDGRKSSEKVVVRCSSVIVDGHRHVLNGDEEVVRFTSNSVEWRCTSCTFRCFRVEEVDRVLLHWGRGLLFIAFYLQPSTLRSVKRTSCAKPRVVVFTPLTLKGNSKSIIKHMFSSTKVSFENALKATAILAGLVEKCEEDQPQDFESSSRVCEFPLGTNNRSLVVTLRDYMCLESQCYLNDVVIDFYLRYVHHVLLQDCHNVHFFSSFFYSKLDQHNMNSNNKMGSKEYEDVKRWTRRIDVFNKDFLILPINEQSHWVVAIICYPGHVRTLNLEAKSPTRDPVILVLDSLSMGSERRIASTLRNFLEWEYRARREEEQEKEVEDKKLFTAKTIRTESPNVPQQTNVFDCGLFVLHYIETFFKDPKRPFEDLLASMSSSWFPLSEVHCKRRLVSELIRQMALNQQLGVQRRRLLPKLYFGENEERDGSSVEETFVNGVNTSDLDNHKDFHNDIHNDINNDNHKDIHNDNDNNGMGNDANNNDDNNDDEGFACSSDNENDNDDDDDDLTKPKAKRFRTSKSFLRKLRKNSPIL